MPRQKIDVVTLSCSKNLVDSERLLSMFKRNGFEVRHDPDSGLKPYPTVIINTCGFIGDAKEESIDTILEYVQAKGQGIVKHIFVMGCLSERYRAQLMEEIPEVDRWYGKFDWTSIVNDLLKDNQGALPYDRVITTPSHHAYLKIAEGCNRFCAFCAIPIITGRYASRTIEDIEAEVRMLVDRGVREFNVIAQDLSSYGLDLYGAMKLPDLIDRIASIPGVEWIRLHYAYPAQFPMEIADVMNRHDNVCKYLDIALQHISNTVLSNMRRHINADQTRSLLAELRRRVPGIHIRTTLMVGFPGEGEKEFDELIEFVKEQKFERMGAFAYCEEEDTFAALTLEDAVPDDIKQDRLSKLMAIQEDIALESNQRKVGQTLKVIIDKEDSDFYIGRSQWDSPEVDPEVLIKKVKAMSVGEFYNVRIIEALPFELIAEPI